MQIANRLIELRQKHGLSQKQFSQILNVPEGTVAEWENGRIEPKIEKLIFIADFFEIDIKYFSGDIEPNNTIKEVSISKCRTNSKTLLALLVLLVVGASLACFLLYFHFSAPSIKELSSSVLLLNVFDENHSLVSVGSGFVTGDDLTLVTNSHVIEGAYYVEAVDENDVIRQLDGIVGYSDELDIAILKFSEHSGINPLEPISDALDKGDEVIAIGSPSALRNSISTGVISSLRTENGIENIQFTAPISSGSSGGALISKRGKVIGITYGALINGQNLNFAIPISYLDKVEKYEQAIPFPSFASSNDVFGNSIVNLNFGEGLLAENDKYIFKSDGKRKLTIESKENKEVIETFNFCAMYLNVYMNYLYFYKVPHSINRINLRTFEVEEDIYKNVDFKGRFSIGRYGVLIIDGNDTIIAMDTRFKNEIKKNIPNEYKVVGFYKEGLLLSRFSAPDRNDLFYFDMESREIEKTELLILSKGSPIFDGLTNDGVVISNFGSPHQYVDFASNSTNELDVAALLIKDGYIYYRKSGSNAVDNWRATAQYLTTIYKSNLYDIEGTEELLTKKNYSFCFMKNGEIYYPR